MISSLRDYRCAGVAVLIHSRWADKVAAINRVSDRILVVSLDLSKDFRISVCAVYLPHCGFGNDALTNCYTELGEAVQKQKRAGRHIIIGGDFNTQVSLGVRGESLAQFVAENRLTICNDREELPWDKIWTFRSSLGTTRQLDYILTSEHIETSNEEATPHLDLGSDHRAVRLQAQFPHKLEERPRTAHKRKWVGSASYGPIIAQTMASMRPNSVAEVEAKMVDAAVSSGAMQLPIRQTRPWDSAELERLRKDRRNCTDGSERRRLSKLLYNKTRQALRASQTVRLQQQLESGRQFSRLGQICAEPVSSKSAVRPPTQAFTDIFFKVYESSDGQNSCVTTGEDFSETIPPTTVPEIRMALRHMSAVSRQVYRSTGCGHGDVTPWRGTAS